MFSDVGISVHAFLEQWGLINYDVEASERPIVVPNAPVPPYTSVVDLFQGGVQPQVLAPIAPLFIEGATSAAPLPVPMAVSTLPLRPDAYARDAGTRLCAVCSADCSRRCYSSGSATTSPAVCEDCYRLGRAPAGTVPGTALMLVEGGTVVHPAGSEWRDEEVLRLLDAVEQHGENWRKVSEVVGGGRTIQQCIAMFLRLPIDEPYRSLKEQSEKDRESAAKEPVIPFSEASNPVMALLAYISSMVSPAAAAAAAKAALGEFLYSIFKPHQSHSRACRGIYAGSAH